MTNDEANPQLKIDLPERTAAFAEEVIRMLRGLKTTAVSSPIISQLVRSATSIGANYCEANDAESKKDFRHKIGLCRKESAETKYWLRMLATAVPNLAKAARVLWREADELNRIFGAILRKTPRA